MAFNLRNRSFLKEIDFAAARAALPAAALRGAQDGEVRRHRGRSARRQGDRADLREDLDAHPVRVRGRRLRPGRPRHLPRPDRARSWATRSRSPTPPGSSAACTTPSSSAATRQADVEELAEYAGVPVYNGLTDEWHPTQMLADFLTMHEASNKPYDEHRLRLHRRLPLQHGPLAAGHGRADGQPTSASPGPTELQPPDDVVDHRRGDRGSAPAPGSRSPTMPPRRVAGRRLHPHRRVGVDGRGQGRVDRAGRAAHAVPGQRRAAGRDRQSAGQVHALPAGVPRHRTPSSAARSWSTPA